MKGYHLTAQSIVHPLTSSLCLSNQSAPCLGLASPANTSLGRSVQGAPLTTTTIMTREDVRAQLAKNPLVWRVIHDGTTSYYRLECIHRSNRVKIFNNTLVYYTIRIQRNTTKGTSLKLDAILSVVMENKELELLGFELPEFSVGEASKTVSNYHEPCRVEKLESMAEAHRLDLICEILGIKE